MIHQRGLILGFARELYVGSRKTDHKVTTHPSFGRRIRLKERHRRTEIVDANVGVTCESPTTL